MRISFFLFSLIAIFLGWTMTANAAPGPGSLIKLSCPANADVNDPCKAVYFYGHDTKRHAFPNDKVYFTWYGNFDGVQTVASSFMTSIPLGQNVTYRPGTKLVKFITDPKVYAVGLGGTLRWISTESAATQLYGADWNKNVDDIPDAFFANYGFGKDIVSSSDFNLQSEQGAAQTIDDDLPSTYRNQKVTTTDGSFAVRVIKLQKDKFKMVTDTLQITDCQTDCPVASLKDYATANTATIGIHGTYFCPAEYPDCATKTNSFLWPFFDSTSKQMRNAGSLAVHQGPMFTQRTDGSFSYFHRTSQVGNATLDAGIANYPALVENGVVIVQEEPKLEDSMKTTKSGRGGIGMDDRFVYLVIANNATVVDLANIFSSLNIKDGMNLDGGGSVSMLYDSAYVAGPGRNIPNAILFVAR